MIRKADIQHVKSIHLLLDYYSKKGELIARPLSELYDHIRDFFVFVNEENNSVEGCCALQFCWEDLAEIRSLAVVENHQKKKIGSRLVEAALNEAKQFKIKDVFTLTYRPDFFSRFEFEVIDRSELPLKIWADCILCVKFPDCDETAMMKRLRS